MFHGPLKRTTAKLVPSSDLHRNKRTRLPHFPTILALKDVLLDQPLNQPSQIGLCNRSCEKKFSLSALPGHCKNLIALGLGFTAHSSRRPLSSCPPFFPTFSSSYWGELRLLISRWIMDRITGPAELLWKWGGGGGADLWLKVGGAENTFFSVTLKFPKKLGGWSTPCPSPSAGPEWPHVHKGDK